MTEVSLCQEPEKVSKPVGNAEIAEFPSAWDGVYISWWVLNISSDEHSSVRSPCATFVVVGLLPAALQTRRVSSIDEPVKKYENCKEMPLSQQNL
jgi:hypothetical protein